MVDGLQVVIRTQRPSTIHHIPSTIYPAPLLLFTCLLTNPNSFPTFVPFPHPHPGIREKTHHPYRFKLLSVCEDLCFSRLFCSFILRPRRRTIPFSGDMIRKRIPILIHLLTIRSTRTVTFPSTLPLTGT